MKKIIKKFLFILLFIVVILTVLSPLSGGIMYAFSFPKVTRPDYTITPGLVNYEEIKDVLPRTEIKYESNQATLNGYYYENKNSDYLVVVSHGMQDGADSLLAVCKYFYDSGYNVFSYDNSGCFDSSGKVQGFSQPLIDLKYTLDFLNENELFKDYKKFLFGLSAGGFAATSVLSFKPENVLCVVSVSAYNDASTLLIDKGKSYVGPLVYVGKPLVEAIQKNKFGDYLSYNAVKGINATNTPSLIIHGKDDKTIRYDVESIIAKKELITNLNFDYLLVENVGHTSVLYSNEANLYQQEVNNQIKSIKNKKQKTEYVNSIDDYAYSHLNEELFNKIVQFYKNCI